MNQSKLGSLIETCANTAIGFVLSYCLGLIVFKAYGLQVSAALNLQITLWFTVLSIARGYVIRRFFNTGLHQWADNLARKFA